ncbi:DHA2 family efflux MFS transporter permease subunit [Umezawaea sp. Da 62-37]|uniref:DHA2 family efflux MFS transporter permease subunit n=1 Tax=Umezawaea sp. Da 62-37 TaxID=3075927 RepID=UPI0028F6C84D|nr:DHA2 family efflux MFS transporter permease subunit [Umezawaea sp. Da 62-37]WNV88508.1 DHA2 family efflux MFS transporter permease subunit [Umezawaea sp. Da 62-37]
MTALSSGTTGKTGVRALVGLILAVSMTTIDQTIVALSAPTIQGQLGLSNGGIQWAVNVYLLATAASFLLGGRLADVFGHKRMVLVGIAAFGVTSLLCGLAPAGGYAEAWLVAARALQGISGAIMFPAAIGIVVQSFSREGRGKAMALFFAVTGAMTAIGPIAGGYLTAWTWRSIFWVNVPIALAALVVVALSAAPSPRRAERIDWIGAGLVALGMGLVVFGLQQASGWGWTSAGVLTALAGGAAFLVAFVVHERRTHEPLVNLRAFRDRGFTLATLGSLFASVAFVPVFFFLSVYGQVSLGLSATTTGLLFLKLFLGFVIASRFGSSMFDRVGARPVLAIGGVLGAVGFGWLATTVTDLDFDAEAFFNQQTWPIAVAGAGIGFMLSAVSTDAVNRAIGASYGEVTALSQSMRNFGGAFGLAVLTTLVTGRLTTGLTTSFEAMGGTAEDARKAVDLVTGAGGDTGAPAAARDQIMLAVRTDYASAVQWAFGGMAIAMAVLLVLAAFYPRDRRQTA